MSAVFSGNIFAELQLLWVISESVFSVLKWTHINSLSLSLDAVLRFHGLSCPGIPDKATFAETKNQTMSQMSNFGWCVCILISLHLLLYKGEQLLKKEECLPLERVTKLNDFLKNILLLMKILMVKGGQNTWWARDTNRQLWKFRVIWTPFFALKLEKKKSTPLSPTDIQGLVTNCTLWFALHVYVFLFLWSAEWLNYILLVYSAHLLITSLIWHALFSSQNGECTNIFM